MLAIIGWLACVAILLCITSGLLLMCLNNLGKYNIGGVLNSLKTKFWAIVVLVLLATSWYFLAFNAPFTINLS